MFPPPQGPGGRPGHPHHTPPAGPSNPVPPGPHPHGPLPPLQPYGAAAPYGTPPGAPPRTPPAPLWEDLGKERRGLWGCGALAVIVLLGFAFSLALSAEEEAVAGAVTTLAFALFISFFLVRAIPRVTAGQGIAVDGGGITFAQEPKWWFRSRTLNVPWHEVVSVRGSDSMRSSQSSDGSGRRTPGVGPLSFYLRRTPPKELVPTWINHVAEGADNPADDSYSPLARLHFTASGGQLERLIGAVRAWRPDLAQAPRPTHAPDAGGPGVHAPDDPGHPQTGQARGGRSRTAQPQAAPDPRFELRGSRRGDWLAQAFVVVVLGTVFAAPVTVMLGYADSLSDLAPVLPLGTCALAALVYGWFLIVSLPRYWTRQGVQLDHHGISTYRERMWWFRGDRSHVGWQNVHHIDSHQAKSGKRYITIIEIHLYRVDHEMRVPSWARLLMAGERKWGFNASSRPVLVFNLDRIGSPRGLLEHLRRTRSDLFREQVADRAVREHDARRRQAWQAEQQGYGPRRPAYSAHTPTDWVNMRPRRIGVWAVGAVVLLYFWVILTGMVYTLTVEGFDPDGLGAMVVVSLIAVPFSTWSLRTMPRCFAHQGMSVDGSGITLVQDPLLWFEGRTAHLPWEGIRMIREDKAGTGSERVLKVFLHHPDALSVVPNWCVFNNRAVDEPPAGAHEPLTLVIVKVPPKHRIRLARAAAAARPDLVVAL